MTKLISLVTFCLVTLPLLSQDPATSLATLPQAKDYVQHRVSSYDRSGGNADARTVAPGETITLLDEAGPGLISHVWFTIASDDPNHLKALVLRMYWDDESTPSVETPVGDFFRTRAGRLPPLPVCAVISWLRQGPEQFFPDAVSETCAHDGDK